MESGYLLRDEVTAPSGGLAHDLLTERCTQLRLQLPHPFAGTSEPQGGGPS